MMDSPLTITILLCLTGNSWTTAASTKSRVAVIGGGIGGTTAALFLREELGDEVDISVYEKGRIGGRIATVELGGRFYESGGAVLHPRNQYMSNLTKALGLRAAKNFPIPLTLGLYDGQDILLQTHGNEYYNKVRFLFRYGKDLLKLDNWIQGLLNWYDGIYPAQRQKIAYNSVYDMFHSLNAIFDEMVGSTIGSYLTKLGFGKRFIHEMARLAMRTNYGQELGIHGFVGSISMAGMQDGMWSVEGGNYRVAEAASKKSGAKVLNSKVTKVKEDMTKSGRQFLVSSVESSGESGVEEFDAVVLAVPCTTAGCGGIAFSVEGIEAKLTKFPKSYHRTVANFIKGKLDTNFFGTSDFFNTFPDHLFAVADEPLFFTSITREVPVDYGTNPNDPKKVSDLDVYKIFTSKPLTKDQVNRIFQSHSEFVVVDWMAYPNYDDIRPDVQGSPSFVLDLDGALISVNAIETAASAMEQSILGAKNAALLVTKYLKKFER